MIGYDGSDCSRRALEFAASLADGGSAVTVATVAPISFGRPDPLWADDQKRLLDEGGRLLAARGVHAETIDPLDEDPANGLFWAAKKIGADLIVMGTHSHGRVGRLLLGSVATAVVEHAPCSMLVVP